VRYDTGPGRRLELSEFADEMEYDFNDQTGATQIEDQEMTGYEILDSR